MLPKSIFVHVSSDGSADGRVKLARTLADRFGARLVGVAVAVPVPPFVTYGAIIEEGLPEEAREHVLEVLERAEAPFRRLADSSGRPSEWRSSIDFPSRFLPAVACGADLLIIGRHKTSPDLNLYDGASPDDVILAAGCPVLVVPPEVSSLRMESIVVAWRNTREARRAVRDALPLFVQADAVWLVAVTEGDDGPASELDDVARRLKLHGVPVHVEHRPSAPVADELIAVARREGADLIVSGAYGHSRLAEWTLGGVTRDLLSRSPICCLMSH